MEVRIQEQDFDAGAEIAAMRQRVNGAGAIVSFIGLVRDQAGEIGGMWLEHYPGMTERALSSILEEAKDRLELLDALVLHRVGRLEAQDQIVLVLAASSHRKDAFESASFIMDNLKTRAPFWKKEITRHGERWVEAKESDELAANRWRMEKENG